MTVSWISHTGPQSATPRVTGAGKRRRCSGRKKLQEESARNLSEITCLKTYSLIRIPLNQRHFRVSNLCAVFPTTGDHSAAKPFVFSQQNKVRMGSKVVSDSGYHLCTQSLLSGFKEGKKNLWMASLFQNPGILKGMMQKVNPFRSSAQVCKCKFDMHSQHAAFFKSTEMHWNANDVQQFCLLDDPFLGRALFVLWREMT